MSKIDGGSAAVPLVAMPAGLPDGRALAEEGRRLGAATTLGRTPFCELHGVRSEAQFKAAQAEAGELSWCMIMGLSSVDEQVAALRYLHELGQASGFVIHRGLIIPNWVSALPPRLREQAPKGTSFVLDGLDDHVRIAQAAPIQPCFNDWHIGSPYCVENTLNAIEAGGSYHGVLAQIAWDLPLWKDDVGRVAENIKAIGAVAAHRDDWLVVDSYMDDGMPSHFLDNASLIGYALLEKYVVDDLCGARYSTGFGGLVSDLLTKMTTWLALHEVLKSDHPCCSYLYGNTISPAEEHLVQNYGVVASEYAVFAAAERRYRTGVSMLPTPITEKVEVPTREAIGDVRLVAGKAAERAAELDPLVRWDVVEAQRDVLIEQGRRFFENALRVLRESGVDVEDPLQVFFALRAIGAGRLEELCHPAERDPGRPRGIVPFVPTELGVMTEEMIGAELATVRARGLGGALAGRCFVVASADTHWYGVYALSSVLQALGAEVVDLGAERDPEYVVEAALEVAGGGGPAGAAGGSGAGSVGGGGSGSGRRPAIAVSTHNGQCVGYSTRLVELLKDAGCRCDVYIGGKLNTIFEGDTEPSDACPMLREVGVSPCRTIAELVEQAAG
jgi:hypothetical protein